MKDAFNNQRGSVTIIVLGAMLVLSILGMALLNLTVAEAIIVQNVADSTQAYYLAEAGIEQAISSLRNNINWTPTPTQSIILQDGIEGKIELNLSVTGNRYTLTSKGIVRSTNEQITAIIEIHSPFSGSENILDLFSRALSYVSGTPELKNKALIIGEFLPIQHNSFPDLQALFNYLKRDTKYFNTSKTFNGNNSGSFHYSGNVSISNGSSFNGILISNGNVKVHNGASYSGIIYAKGDIDLDNSSFGTGDVLVIAEGNVNLGNSANSVYIIAGGQVILKNSSFIDGSIVSYQAPILHNSSIVRHKNPDPDGTIIDITKESFNVISRQEK